MKGRRKLIRFKELKVGDVFNVIPVLYYGKGTVTKSYRDGNQWCVEFTNPRIVHSPGIIYNDPNADVCLYKKPEKKSPEMKKQVSRKLETFWALRSKGQKRKRREAKARLIAKKRWNAIQNSSTPNRENTQTGKGERL